MLLAAAPLQQVASAATLRRPGFVDRRATSGRWSRRSGSPAVENVVMRTIERRPRRSWFADVKAEALAWWVRRASDQRLQSVMRSRFRGVLSWQIFRTICQRAQPDITAVVEFRITGRRDGGIDRYQLTLADGRCRRARRSTRRPELTLELEPVAFLHLVGGTASPPRLLISGKLKVRGDLMLALALPKALRLPRRLP
jgi:SCP-2 sterol transfer family